MANSIYTPASATILREVEKAIEEEEKKKVDITPTTVDIAAKTVEERIEETKSPVFKKKKKRTIRTKAPSYDKVETPRGPTPVVPDPTPEQIVRQEPVSRIKRDIPLDEQAEIKNLERDIREYNLLTRDLKKTPGPLQDFDQQQALQKRRESIVARLDMNQNVQRVSEQAYAVPGVQEQIIESLGTQPETLISGIEPRLTEFYPIQQTRPTVPIAPITPEPLSVIAAPEPSLLGKAAATPLGQFVVGLGETTPLAFVDPAVRGIKSTAEELRTGIDTDPLRAEGIPVKIEPLPGQFYGMTQMEKERQRQTIESMEAQQFLTKERQLGQTVGAIADIALLPGDEFSSVLTRQADLGFEGVPRTTGIAGDIKVRGRARRIGETRALDIDPSITTQKPSVFLDYTETGLGPSVKTRIELKPDKTIIKTQKRDATTFITTQKPGDKFSTTKVLKNGNLKKTIKNPPLTSEKTIVDSVIRTKPETEVLTTPEGVIATQRQREITKITQPLRGRDRITGFVAQEDIGVFGSRPGIKTTIQEDIFVKDDLISTLRTGAKLEEPPITFKGQARRGPPELLRTEQYVGDDIIKRELVVEAIPTTKFETGTEIKGRLRIEKEPLPPVDIPKIRGKKAQASSLLDTLGQTTVTRQQPIGTGIELPVSALRPTGSVLDILTRTATPVAVSRLRGLGALRTEEKPTTVTILRADTKQDQELGTMLDQKKILEEGQIITQKRKSKGKTRQRTKLVQEQQLERAPQMVLEPEITSVPLAFTPRIITGTLPGIIPIPTAPKLKNGKQVKGSRRIRTISKENFLRNLYSETSPRTKNNLKQFL